MFGGVVIVDCTASYSRMCGLEERRQGRYVGFHATFRRRRIRRFFFSIVVVAWWIGFISPNSSYNSERTELIVFFVQGNQSKLCCGGRFGLVSEKKLVRNFTDKHEPLRVISRVKT